LKTVYKQGGGHHTQRRIGRGSFGRVGEEEGGEEIFSTQKHGEHQNNKAGIKKKTSYFTPGELPAHKRKNLKDLKKKTGEKPLKGTEVSRLR